MLEIPEAHVISSQIREAASGRTIEKVLAASSPHKFAWFFGEPAGYASLLTGQTIDGAQPLGGLVEITAGRARIVAGDGTAIRLYEPGQPLPAKHQLLLGLDNGAALVFSVQMYGGIWAFGEGQFANPYYEVATVKPSPLSPAFDEAYFAALLDGQPGNLTAKALLATGQRIPGLGNGTLQDILLRARIHPRRKLRDLSGSDLHVLYTAIHETLQAMVSRGGRATEKDLRGDAGGFASLAWLAAGGKPCPQCGGRIIKEIYLGGSIYFCPACQPTEFT